MSSRVLMILGAFTVAEIPQAVASTDPLAGRSALPSWKIWETLAQVESSLNRVGTMRARFLQISRNNSMNVSKGTIFLSQPGRMRLEYDPPSHVMIVSNGWHLIYHDADLEQTSYIRLDATPAGVMLQTPVHLKDDVTVTDARRMPGTVEASLLLTQDPSAGELSLLFGERPFTLKQWRIKDLKGQIITVSLYAVKTGLTFDPDFFKFQSQDPPTPHTSWGALWHADWHQKGLIACQGH